MTPIVRDDAAGEDVFIDGRAGSTRIVSIVRQERRVPPPTTTIFFLFSEDFFFFFLFLFSVEPHRVFHHRPLRSSSLLLYTEAGAGAKATPTVGGPVYGIGYFLLASFIIITTIIIIKNEKKRKRKMF
jgi:hypothetical protein